MWPGWRREMPSTRAWTPSNGVASRSAPRLRVDDVEVPVLVAAGVLRGRPGGGRPAAQRYERIPRSVSSVTGRAPSPSRAPTHTFRTSSTGARWASRRPSGATSGDPRSGFPKRILRGIRSATPRTLSGAPSDGARTLLRMDSRPIGMFDSGVGGLTVLHECLVTLPHEDFVYFGDSHPDRFPYGPKPADVIARVRPRGRRPPGRARREADRGRVQRGHRRRRCPASSASSPCR